MTEHHVHNYMHNIQVHLKRNECHAVQYEGNTQY